MVLSYRPKVAAAGKKDLNLNSELISFDALSRADLFDFLGDVSQHWPVQQRLRAFYQALKPAATCSEVSTSVTTYGDRPTAAATCSELPGAPWAAPLHHLPMPTPVRTAPLALLPKVRLIDTTFACDGAYVQLDDRPLTLRLLQVFCEAKDYQVTRDELLARVYQIDHVESHSARYRESKSGNGVKLISRTRKLIRDHIGQKLREACEWFVYDRDRKVWCLFRLRHSYLQSQLGD